MISTILTLVMDFFSIYYIYRFTYRLSYDLKILRVARWRKFRTNGYLYQLKVRSLLQTFHT